MEGSTRLLLSGRDTAAASITEQSLTLLREIDDHWKRAYPLIVLGQIKLQRNELIQAHDLFEESRITFKEVGDQAGMAVAKARAQAGDEAFAKAWNEGRVMTVEQAITRQP